MMYGYGGGFDGGWGGGPSIIMMFGMAIFWIAIILMVVFAIRRFAGRGHGCHPGHMGHHGFHGNFGPPQDDAMELLRRRFAAGEITPEDFEKMKEQLLK